ncbi:membrane protein [Streptococcus pneumoniae]|nr:membrane protein [Streptococcus pneumoniae]
MSFLSKNGAGILACLLISILSWYLGGFFPVIGAPVFAIFIGMLLHPFLSSYKQLDAGLTFSSKKLLQYAVVLLGFGLNISQVFAVGQSSLPVILSTISIALIIAYLFQRFFALDTKLATLVGVGSSICGGSAIAATAPVIHAKEKEVAQAISVIFFFNVLAALIFPTLGTWLHLSNEGFALFAGTAVNDTSSVTAAASAWDSLYQSNTLESATIVKLTRTLAIIPITLFLSYWQSRQQENKQSLQLKKVFPLFILYFILASLLTTLLTSLGVSSSFFTPLKQLSKFLIVMAMSAIGLKTNLVAMVKSSGKSIVLGAICWIAIILTTLGMQTLIGIFLYSRKSFKPRQRRLAVGIVTDFVSSICNLKTAICNLKRCFELTSSVPICNLNVF